MTCETRTYAITAICEADGADPQSPPPAFFNLSRLTVDKAVDGTVPDGATFQVQVTCPADGDEPDGVDTTLDFDAAGGSQPVVLYQWGMDCTISEPGPGGADNVTIDPETAEFGFEGPYEITATVTNTFAAEPEPTPTPTPVPEPTATPTPTPEPTQPPVKEAEPAAPVEAQPSYTG